MASKSLHSLPVRIVELVSREVLDSRGFPTVEVDLTLSAAGQNFTARAIVPSGASTGEGEALELRDGDSSRFLGKGVLKAVQNVVQKIKVSVVGRDWVDLSSLDQHLIALDGTENKSALGANAILAVSMAFARAHAQAAKAPLFQYIASAMGTQGVTLPVPLMNVLNGGKHADNGLAIQEFMVVPVGFESFRRALQAGAEVFHHLKKTLHAEKLSTGVGDEGGFAPEFKGEHPHEQAIQALMKAIQKAGYKPGQDFYLALDCAASEYSPSKGMYQFEGKQLTSKQMIDVYAAWAKAYPILSIEDGMAEHDWEGWAQITQVLGGKVQLVGDDLFVTNPKVLAKGIESKTANSILIKLNQIGTVTETLETLRMASLAKYTAISSHRSGESEDTFIADLAVGSDCGQIKTGSLCRTDRTAKYNQLLRIEEILGKNAKYAARHAFSKQLMS